LGFIFSSESGSLAVFSQVTHDHLALLFSAESGSLAVFSQVTPII